jgi:hypothetical protein
MEMWDDSSGHHTEMKNVNGKTVFAVYSTAGELLCTVTPRTMAEEIFYRERLDSGDCFICDALENDYEVQC